ncbi:hypothetical protein FKW77_006480 [Venturia effusa]|uniref:Proteasome assembly chaperone 3 n=1 Tax=Venturia effusa TaxID=50376 RepID=A0A517LN06_9PEZI|nr:hypothetical protein FKW77_006480 [Venturia effusa]
MDTSQVQHSPFPARTKTTVCTIASHPTTITSHSFADKIMITISQDGRLGHWIHVPLAPTPSSSTNGPEPTLSNDLDSDLPPSTLLPDSHHTATTILGGTGTPNLDTLGQLLATQLASLLCSRNPDEGRMLVLGLGLRKDMGESGKVGREEFAEMVGGVLDVL